MAAPFQILAFSRTVAYRHASIPAGLRALDRLAASSSSSSNPFTITATEDPDIFTPSSLAQFKVIIFLQSSGEFLTSADQLDALQGFVRSGGGVVAIHCASFALESSEWYGRLIGAVFQSHPQPTTERVWVVDPTHPIIAGSLEKSSGMHLRMSGEEKTWEWEWLDEWYLFKQSSGDIADNVHVLLTGGAHDRDHPVAWCQEFEGGRSFYTSLGHFDAAYEDDVFLAQLLGGLLWAARV